MMIKRELELAFAAAVREAQRRRHEMLTVEHILYALLYDEMGSRILANCGADIDQLKGRLDDGHGKIVRLHLSERAADPASRGPDRADDDDFTHGGLLGLV